MNARYRQSRSINLPRRTALRHAIVPDRVEVAWNALRGRPVMYRLTMRGASHPFLLFTSDENRNAVISNCTFIGPE